MKKKLSKLFYWWAKRLDQTVVVEEAPEARPIGICIHISKKDVRDFRKDHPQVKSHREGLKVLSEEARYRVAGAIARGLMQNGAIYFETKKTLSVADVSGIVYVYGGEKGEECQR